MIQRIFATIQGVVPYKTKKQVSYHSIQTYDTPYTVKSRGCLAWYYAWPEYSLEPAFSDIYKKFTGNAPFVRMYSGKSYPAEIASEVYTSDQFGIVYTGYFIPESTSATFFLKGVGKARMVVAGGFDTGTIQLGTDRVSISTLHVTGMTAGVGKLTSIKYMSPDSTSQKENVFTVTWKDSTLPKEIPLAAGNFKNPTDYLSGVTAKTLRFVGDVQLSKRRGQTAELTFSVPVVTSSSSSGYRYDDSADYLYDAGDSTRTIKKFRMVEFHTGYKYPSGTIATITKFVGQVRGWNITRGVDGADTAVIKCQDWSSFLNDVINEGFPNTADYLIADYVDPVSREGVAGDKKTRAYDGWRLDKAVDSLLYNACIDPKTVLGRKTYINTAGTLEEGYYLFHDRNASNPIILDKPIKYGNPFAVTSEGADDPYIWQFSIGELLADNMQRLMDNYGFRYGFNETGKFYVKSMKNPVVTKSIDEMTLVSNWSERTSTRMVYGVSKETNTNGDTATATYSGRNCRFIFSVAPTFGTLHVRLSNADLGIVATTDISLVHTTARSFFDGVDDSIGYNPCEVSIGEGLAYGVYSLNLECKSNATVSVNAILVNDEQYFSEVELLYSGDTLSGINGVLTNDFNIESSVENVRNDVIVVGRLFGVNSNLSLAEGEDARINPSNPVAEHVVGRAVDRVSIASLSSINFTGRKLQTIIIDPAIATEERAYWLASETTKRYNRFNKSMAPVLNMITNPLLDLEDRIAVKDIKIGVLGTFQDFWITGITSNYGTNGESVTQLEVESFEPWESFFKYPTPSLARFSNTVFANGVVYNTGLPLNPNGDFCYLDGWEPSSTSPATINIVFTTQDKSTTVSDVSNRVPPFGYVKIHNEVIQYQQRTVESAGIYNATRGYHRIVLSDLRRGMYNTATLADLATYRYQRVEMQFSPYLTEEYNIGPSVGFDLIAPGHVRVAVLSQTNDLVDVPTNASNTNSEWVFLQPGSYLFSWGCLDRYGAYNEANGGYFVYSGNQTYDTPMTSPGQMFGWFPFFGTYADQYKVSSDRYVVNRAQSKYGQFVFDVQYKDPTGQITKETKKLFGLKNVHTVMRVTNPNTYPGGTGIHEEFRVSSASEVDYTTLGSIWYSQTLGRNIVSNLNQSTYQQTYRWYYTGDENDGLGAKINIKNEHAQTRIIGVELKRYVFSFIRVYRERYKYSQQDGARWVPETVIELVDAGEEVVIPAGNFSWQADGIKGLDVYVPKATEGFITQAMTARIDRALHSDNNGLQGDYFRMDRVKTISVSQLHCIEIKTTDFSGYKDTFRRSLWYVAPEFHNTEADFTSGNPKISAYDPSGLPFEDMVFRWKDSTGPAFIFLDQLPGGQYRNIVVSYNDAHPHAVYTEGIYGVKIFGVYQ